MEPSVAVLPSAPLVHRAEQPTCLECEHRFPQSFLFDKFDWPVCEECRDEAGEHALLTRTEAKTEFLLKDCDLDSRPPPLRCVRRRNPHSARFGDMRLYLLSQVRARALLVWGSEQALEAERARRAGARAAGRAGRESRKLRALRLDVRSSLFSRRRADHTHEFGAERPEPGADEYSRECLSCGYVETYEKM